MRPDNIIQILNKKISRECKLAFLSALIIGLIAHTYMFTNKIPNYDDLRTIDGFGTTFRSGRWFLWIVGTVAYHLDFVFSLPWMNGLIFVCLIALSAML